MCVCVVSVCVCVYVSVSVSVSITVSECLFESLHVTTPTPPFEATLMRWLFIALARVQGRSLRGITLRASCSGPVTLAPHTRVSLRAMTS